MTSEYSGWILAIVYSVFAVLNFKRFYKQVRGTNAKRKKLFGATRFIAYCVSIAMVIFYVVSIISILVLKTELPFSPLIPLAAAICYYLWLIIIDLDEIGSAHMKLKQGIVVAWALILVCGFAVLAILSALGSTLMEMPILFGVVNLAMLLSGVVSIIAAIYEYSINA